jgi:hypothetical protein
MFSDDGDGGCSRITCFQKDLRLVGPSLLTPSRLSGEGLRYVVEIFPRSIAMDREEDLVGSRDPVAEPWPNGGG